MSINELPDECLLIIFRLINDLDDLLNCYKVCSKWNHLIEERTKKVKYLVEHDGNWPNDEQFPSCTPDYVYYRSEEPIDATCLSTLFPNLIIGDFSYGFCKKVKLEDIATLFKEIKSLKGLIHEFYNKNDPIIHYWDQLEMVSSGYIEPCMENASANIKQLHLWNYTLDEFKKGAQYFPNLERLSIHNNEGSPDWLYDGPILRKLKIVELSLSSYDGTDIYYGFQFMDSCPNLQSAHIKLDSNRIFVDESVKHTSLRDLVLHFYSRAVDWNELKRLFMKYPNLKHLSLVSNKSLDDEQVEQLVRILPNLVLFAVRGCPRVTEKAADYIENYCKLYGRSIKFYFNKNYHEIGSDFPQLLTKYVRISQGFDFMKHCFLKDCQYLSTFLTSNED